MDVESSQANCRCRKLRQGLPLPRNHTPCSWRAPRTCWHGDPVGRAIRHAGRKPQNPVDVVVGTPLLQQIDQMAVGSVQQEVEVQEPAQPVGCQDGESDQELVAVLDIELAWRVVPENRPRTADGDAVRRPQWKSDRAGQDGTLSKCCPSTAPGGCARSRE